MRLRNIPGAREIVASDSRFIPIDSELKGRWNKIFEREAPIFIEIGMGKGRFIIDMALKHPEADFVGIERYESVMVKAIRKLERREEAGEPVPENIRFFCADAADLRDFFLPGEVDGIYLNFSDPWPKERHAKRRLTYRTFLDIFSILLKKGGKLEFKTDNLELFVFSLSELEHSGWKVGYTTFDLHGDAAAMEDNIMTEYEEKFSAAGNKICKVVSFPPEEE